MTQDDFVGSFDFRSGAQRGARFTLYPRRLVFHANASTESIQLGSVGSVRVSFERDGGKLGWAVAIAIIALLVFLVSAPLAAWSGQAAENVLAQLRQGGGVGHGIGGVMVSVLESLANLASLLPVVAAVLGAWAIALFVFGWIGVTTLTLTVGPAERAYGVRGRNSLLLDFAEAISAAVAQLHG